MEGLGLQRPVGCRLGVGCRCCFALLCVALPAWQLFKLQLFRSQLMLSRLFKLQLFMSQLLMVQSFVRQISGWSITSRHRLRPLQALLPSDTCGGIR